MKAELIVLVLWLVTIITSVLVVSDSSDFMILGPVYGICAVGSVIAVRHERKNLPLE